MRLLEFLRVALTERLRAGDILDPINILTGQVHDRRPWIAENEPYRILNQHLPTRVISVEPGVQFFNHLGIVGGHIMFLHTVFGNVVKVHAGQQPPVLPDHTVLILSLIQFLRVEVVEEDRAVIVLGIERFFQVRFERTPGQFHVLRHIKSAQIQHRRINVMHRYQRVVLCLGPNFPGRPAKKREDTMAPLFLRTLLASHAHVPVIRRQGNGRALHAVVRRHENDGICIKPRLLQAGHQATDVFIEVVNHSVQDR